MTTVYKVCRLQDGKMTSAITLNNWMLEYKIGEKTTPINGFIFAFDTIEHARHFADVNFRFFRQKNVIQAAILECQADVVQMGQLPGVTYITDQIGNLMILEATEVVNKQSVTDKYWDLAIRNIGQDNYTQWWVRPMPTGTVFCSAITPLEVVKGDHDGY